MSKMMNVALVGLGIGRSHITEGYVTNADLFRVKTLCDLNAERLQAVGDEFSIAHRTTDFDSVLADPQIDIVDLCTPPGTHYEMILKALDAGKHVICEKPLVGSLAAIDRVMAREKTAQGRLMPIFQYRYGDGAQKAKKIIEAGLAGKPYVATAETHWQRLPEYYAVPWRGKWATELGGVLMTHAIHLNDMLTYLMGPIAAMYSRIATRVNAIEVEDCVSMSLEMKNGALATISATLGSVEEISRLRLCFENVVFESNHEAYNPGIDPWKILPTTPETGEKIAALLENWQPVPNRFGGQFRAFHQALVTGGPLPVTTADARASLELITGCYFSSDNRQEVTFPLNADNAYYQGWRPQ
ncbi:Gfo/Idh/MocA family oxidoreductase [Allorhizobium sp. BGMRC 0089]|uniref:Gfo/Idh/MocA family protein n=1 Tax=Allorhizobium sonneratiae TaxID=2934936 RepID=UPI0020338CA5|nr:Gfo/Idh/MocA family oxidoreductase [Allorhizobium sonneratiae]MCM2293134.1 Gfo/Idh/MocA family oxidoreductase [Allorhizobium sonneratiae]